MSYPFVPARYYSRGTLEEVRALVVHFAEGGGTVSFLQHPDKDVSATFVIQYSGRIVQMVADGDSDHCQHISYGAWSYPGGLSRLNGLAVLGADVMNSTDPTRVNRFVRAVEIEGFRADGPNPAQVAALVALVADQRAKYPELRGLLGHGDIQNKACPGALIPWDLLGGHGLFTREADVLTTITVLPWGGRFRFTANVTAFHLADDGTVDARATLEPATYPNGIAYDATVATTATRGGPFVRIDSPNSQYDGFLVAAAAVTETPNPAPVPAPDPAVVKAAADKAVNAALDHVEGAVAGTLTAIHEARPRP